jgi:AcrR family transcriptional regulator
MRADAQKNYQRLLDVAREALAETGADASLRDIARRAEVGLGTLYRHFPTREALLEALLRNDFEGRRLAHGSGLGSGIAGLA